MSAGREEANFKKAVEDLIREFQRRVASSAPAAFSGAPEDAVLEHTARKHFLDKLLMALGWDIANLDHDIVEEARVKDNTTLFMDYLGVHPTSRAPVLIFEAKAWEKPIVTASAVTLAKAGKIEPTHADLISLALAHCKKNEDKDLCPVSQEWREWILKLKQYASSVERTSGHLVHRVAISAGPWIVVFNDPANAFLDNAPIKAGAIVVFRIEDYVTRSDELYGLLARANLVGAPPEFIRPEQITAHLSAKAVRKLFRGIWIHRSETGSPFDVHPRILVYPALLAQRADEEFVTIVDKDLGHDAIPNDGNNLGAHVESTRERSERLFAAVRALLPDIPTPSTLIEFPGFMRSPARGSPKKVYAPADADRDFLRSYEKKGGQFVLATGQDPHFILAEPRVAGCRAHDWVACRGANQHVGNAPITSRSVEPASFFISQEPHHCAHRIIHARREGRCKVRAFETYLCCQACAFQSVCWEGVTDLPCGERALAGGAGNPQASGAVAAN